jgi:uncharacterized protein with HEPN domain
MREEDEIHVNNIINCINEIEGYVEGMTYEDFSNEEEVRLSVVSNLQEIGEAATLLSDDFVSQFSDVDMRVLVSLKRAKYDEHVEMDYRPVWNVINDDLPAFRDMLSTASEQMHFGDDDDFGDFDDFDEGGGRYKKSGRFDDDFDDDPSFDDEDEIDLDDEDDRY